MTKFHPDPDPSRPNRGEAAPGWTIALDGGTTNTRARLLHGTRLVATARRAVGVRDTVLDRAQPRPSPTPAGPADRGGLVRAVREVVEEAREYLARAGGDAGAPAIRPRIVAAGMLSSEVGLVAVPHVPAPAGLDELARGSVSVDLPEVDDRPILVVPGVRTPAADGPDGWFESDLMRGEECETLGAHAALLADGRLAAGEETVFVWPGSHTKLVAVDGAGRIVRSVTTLAGEVLQAVARHTLVSASLPAALPDDLDRDAAEAGARAARRHGLGRAAFLVRIAALGTHLDEHGRASFWIGAAVEADVLSLVGSRILEGARTLRVGGRQPLRALYASALERHHARSVVALDDPTAEAASALGAIAIADRHPGRDAAARA